MTHLTKQHRALLDPICAAGLSLRLSSRQKPLRQAAPWRGIDNMLARLPTAMAPVARRQARRLRRGLRRWSGAHALDCALPPELPAAAFYALLNRIDRLNRTGSHIQIVSMPYATTIVGSGPDLRGQEPQSASSRPRPAAPATAAMQPGHHRVCPRCGTSAQDSHCLSSPKPNAR